MTGPVMHAIRHLKHKKIRVEERTPHPWKVHELMVARGYSNETAMAMLEALQKSKGEFGHKPMAKNGHIIDHPGEDRWWKPFAKKVIHDDSMMKDHSKFHHLMQVAFAEHEFTAEYTDDIIDFCEGQGVNRPLRFAKEFGREKILKGPDQTESQEEKEAKQAKKKAKQAKKEAKMTKKE